LPEEISLNVRRKSPEDAKQELFLQISRIIPRSDDDAVEVLSDNKFSAQLAAI
jgi:hypothetical protein